MVGIRNHKAKSPCKKAKHPGPSLEMWDRRNEPEIRNQIAEQFGGVVANVALKVHAQLCGSVSLDDLMQTGQLGLFDAIKAFDPSRGIKFGTFSYRRIFGAMLDSVRDMDWVPRLVRAKASEMKKAIVGLHKELGRDPSDDELAGRLQITLSALEKVKEDIRPILMSSLNQCSYDHHGNKLVHRIETVPDSRGCDPTRRLTRADLVRRLLKGLNKQEKVLMLSYYFEEMTMKEIGRQLDLSESRVSQMHSSILGRLQSTLSPEDARL